MEENKSKKTYMFYVSDYHFEMIGLLNISKELKEDKKVIVITENNLENSIETLLSKINIKEEEKNKIKQIDWSNCEEPKYKKIEEAINNDDKISIYIKGKEEYIKNQNKKIQNLTKDNNKVSIIDCYDFMEIEGKSEEIANNYEEVLITDKKIKIKDR